MNKETTSTNIYDTTIRLFFLFLIIAWCIMIMYPFVSIILWSLIFAMALNPLHSKLSKKLGDRPKLTSFIIILLILVIIFLPTSLLVDSLINEVKGLTMSYENGELTIPPPAEKVKDWPLIGNKLYESWQDASINLGQTIEKNKDQLTEVVSKLAKGILSSAGGLVQILVSIIIAGVLLVFDGLGESIRKLFRKLAGNKGDEFADTTIKTVGNVVKGVIGVALILALIHGILFTLAGIPYAGIWTLLIFVFTLLQLPAIFVTLPIIVYLFSVKEPLPAVIWSILLVVAGLSDNFLKPILLGKGAPVPMLVIFIGVVGGFIFSGFIGLFTGAIIMSIGYKLFMSWINYGNEVVQT